MPASGDVGRASFAHFEREIGRHPLPRLVQPPLTGEDLTGQHQRLRLGPALDEPALDEQLIETLLFLRTHFNSSSSAFASLRSAVSKPSTNQ